jgi:hypothetical protein
MKFHSIPAYDMSHSFVQCMQYLPILYPVLTYLLVT